MILILILVAFWFLFSRQEQVRHNPDVRPKVVEARGDLAADEQSTISVFRSSSPSVVYITSLKLRRGLFSLNVQEIPKGTGSGFIWDKGGRIVTNYHVIRNSNKVHVTLADNSTWKIKGQPQGVAPTLSLPDVVHHFKTMTTKRYTDGIKQFSRNTPTLTNSLPGQAYLGQQLPSGLEEVVSVPGAAAFHIKSDFRFRS